MTDRFSTPPEGLLPPREVAGILNVSPRTLETWRSKGKGPAFVKLEGVVRYRLGDLDAFIEAGVPAPQSEGVE